MHGLVAGRHLGDLGRFHQPDPDRDIDRSGVVAEDLVAGDLGPAALDVHPGHVDGRLGGRVPHQGVQFGHHAYPVSDGLADNRRLEVGQDRENRRGELAVDRGTRDRLRVSAHAVAVLELEQYVLRVGDRAEREYHRPAQRDPEHRPGHAGDDRLCHLISLRRIITFVGVRSRRP